MLTYKEHHTLTLEKDHEIRLLQQQVKILYNQDSNYLDNHFKVAKGEDAKQRIYYFVSANGSISAVLDFSQFKPEVRQFVFVLNLDSLPGSEIKLPKNAQSYIIRQSHANFRVLNTAEYYMLDAENPDLRKRVSTSDPPVAPRKTLPPLPAPLTPAQLQAKKFADYTAALNAFEQNGVWGVSGYAPRPYQLRAMREYLQTRESNRNAVFGLSTGVGKTYLFATTAQLLQEKVLVIVPLRTLLEQTKQQFAKFAPNLKAKIWDAKWVPDVNRYDVFIVTVQTLCLVYTSVNYNVFDVVVLDEAHNYLSEDRVHVVKHIAQSRARMSAFTATPWLTTRRKFGSDGLNSVYQLLGYHYDGSDSVISRFPINMAIDTQANVPLVTRIVMPDALVDDDDDVDVDDSASEDKQRVSHIHNTPQYHLMVADVYLNGSDPVSGEFYRGQRAIVFCSGIKHAIAIEAIFDTVLIKMCTNPDRIKNLVDHIYLEMERDAFFKKYKKGYEAGSYWQGEEKQRMFAKAEKKAQRRIAAEMIDPTGYWRQRYADNVRNEFAAKGIALGQYEYNTLQSKFRVAKAVFSGSTASDADSLDNKKCEQIINKFRLGGYLMLTGADKLTEGFDNSDVSLIIFARSTGSDRILCQGVGRGMRINPNEPAKFCTVIQLQVNKSAYKRYRYAYEIISSTEQLRFSYGNTEGCRAQRRAPIPGFMPIPIDELARYKMLDSPEQLPRFFFPKEDYVKLEDTDKQTKKSAKRVERPEENEETLQQATVIKKQQMDAMNNAAMIFLGRK